MEQRMLQLCGELCYGYCGEIVVVRDTHTVTGYGTTRVATPPEVSWTGASLLLPAAPASWLAA